MLQFSHVEIIVRDRVSPSSARVHNSPADHRLGGDNLFVTDSQGSSGEGNIDSSLWASRKRRKLSRPTHNGEWRGSGPDKYNAHLADLAEGLKFELEATKEENQSLRESLEAEQGISSARKNTISDYSWKLQKQQELEQVLRDVAKSDRAESAGTINKLRATVDDLQERAAEHWQTSRTFREEKIALEERCTSLEADLRAAQVQVKDLQTEVATCTNDVKRKDDYIGQIHRQSDTHDEQIRALQQEVAKVQAESHRALETEQARYDELLKAYSANLPDQHHELVSEQENVYEGQVRNMITIIEQLEIAVTSYDQREAQPSDTAAKSLSDIFKEIIAPLRNGDMLSMESKSEKISSESKGEAYMKLLKANLLLEKEKLLLTNKLQDLTFQLSAAKPPSSEAATKNNDSEAGIQNDVKLATPNNTEPLTQGNVDEPEHDSVSAAEVGLVRDNNLEALVEQIDQLRKEVEDRDAEVQLLQDKLVDEERRAERLEELAEIGKNMMDKYGDEDGWEIATQLVQ